MFDTKEVKKALIDKGWSITYLAQKIGASRVLTSYLIHNHKCVKARPTAEKIANVLDVNIIEAA